MDVEVEEAQFRRLEKLNRNLSSGLDDQEDDDMDDKDDKSDRSLSPPRESARRTAAVERARAREREGQEFQEFQHARSKSAARSSGARGSNEPAAGNKRTIKEVQGPTSPGAIRKAARTYWHDAPKRMAWHTAVEFRSISGIMKELCIYKRRRF